MSVRSTCAFSRCILFGPDDENPLFYYSSGVYDCIPRAIPRWTFTARSAGTKRTNPPPMPKRDWRARTMAKRPDCYGAHLLTENQAVQRCLTSRVYVQSLNLGMLIRQHLTK